MQSSRADGKGHWPKGKRRNQELPGWRLTLGKLERLSLQGAVSLRKVAAAMGVSDRAVRMWISRETTPKPHLQAKLATLVDDRVRLVNQRDE